MKTALILLLLCLVPVLGFAGEKPAEAFFGGGGPMPTLLFLDLEDLNHVITGEGFPQLSQVLFANGGGGYGGIVDGLRLGGFGLSADTLSVSDSQSISLDMSYGGLMIEKAVRNDADFTVVLGTLLGFGSLDLRIIDGVPSTFADAIATPFISAMSKDFYAVQPYIAFESNPFSWMSARFQLGFLWALADPWAFEENVFAGPPRTLTGLTATLMLRFGGADRIAMEEVEAAIEELSQELESWDAPSPEATEPEPADPAEPSQQPIEAETP